MSVTGSRIVEVALSFKGRAEVPAGSNRGPFVQACQADTWLSGTGWPWCAAFVCHVARLCGVPLTGANSAGAHDLANRHAANWITDKARWKPGMAVDYNLGSGHTGILIGVDLRAGVVTSCDGNFGDKVTVHTEPISLVRAVWAIPGVTYVTTPAPPVVVPKHLPPFVVSTSANGTRKVLFTAQKKAGLVAWLTSRSLAKIAPNGITIRRGRAV
jgi:hypothetical protein